LVGLHLLEAGGLIDARGTVACELLAQLGGNLIAMFAFSCDLGATSFREVMWPSPRGLVTLL